MGVQAVKIRKLPDWVLEAHRKRAEEAGVSLEEELRKLLTESALRPQREFAARVTAWNNELRRRYGQMSDSKELIRQDRDERG
ncbi:MAG: hypothetical protein HY235_23040 [Acidobacteria bacterium]|nr:hypothetical protein [Acidobacteriota bacterium]